MAVGRAGCPARPERILVGGPMRAVAQGYFTITVPSFILWWMLHLKV